MVALSGGADSVFLLYALYEIADDFQFKIGACHIEHGIRGESSIRDMKFAEELCNKLGIEFFSKRFDVPEIAKNEKLSVEAAGRKVRYEYFSHIMKEHGYNILATAHHLDDKIETVVMNILRGCSLRGFAGIEYKNSYIIRPLLDITKKEIVGVLAEKNIEYCTDETNSDLSYTRNRIRHVLMPALKEFNPAVEDAFLRQSTIFSDEDDYMNSVADKVYENCVCDGKIVLDKFQKCHIAIQRRVIYRFLSDVKGTSADITASDVEVCVDMCKKGETGKKLSLSDGVEVGTEYGCFGLAASTEIPDFEYKLSINNPVLIKELGIKLTIFPEGGTLSINENDNVIVRNRRKGDVFCPTGMTGRKKIKEFFSDLKIPRYDRSKIPLIIVNGDIASVPGIRDDRRFSNCGGTCRIHIEKF